MKNPILLVVLTMVFLACKPVQSDSLISIQYKAQTRGYSLSIAVNQGQIIRIENGKETVQNLTAAQWNALENNINSIDFSSIKEQLNKEFIAVDRVIPAKLTIIKGDKTQQFNLSHNTTPPQLKTLFELIQIHN